MSKETWEGIQGIVEIIGPPLISLASVWLGWRLGWYSSRHQRRLDYLRERIGAFREIRSVLDNVPPNISSHELYRKLEADSDFKSSISGRMVRLFGLRTELIPLLDKEVYSFIDTNLKPLYVIQTGLYTFRQDKVKEFAEAVNNLCALSDSIEKKLINEYEDFNK